MQSETASEAAGAAWDGDGAEARRVDDVIHGPFELSPTATAVTQHAAWTRLHQIRQLGAATVHFPTATHTRAEHCIGVAFLARRLGEALRAAQPELGIGDRQVLWLELAGLCHDVGHCCTSHTFDECYWRAQKHEWRSQELVRYMARDRSLGLTKEDTDWIAWIIDPKTNVPEPPRWAFLGTVLSSNPTGMDVDRMDYISRDAHYLLQGHEVTWRPREIVDRARVLVDRVHYHRDDAPALRGINCLRRDFHLRFYNHPRVVCIDASLKMLLRSLDQPSTVEHVIRDIAENFEFFAEWTDDVFGQRCLAAGGRVARNFLAVQRDEPMFRYLGMYVPTNDDSIGSTYTRLHGIERVSPTPQYRDVLETRSAGDRCQTFSVIVHDEAAAIRLNGLLLLHDGAGAHVPAYDFIGWPEPTVAYHILERVAS